MNVLVLHPETDFPFASFDIHLINCSGTSLADKWCFIILIKSLCSDMVEIEFIILALPVGVPDDVAFSEQSPAQNKAAMNQVAKHPRGLPFTPRTFNTLHATDK